MPRRGQRQQLSLQHLAAPALTGGQLVQKPGHVAAKVYGRNIIAEIQGNGTAKLARCRQDEIFGEFHWRKASFSQSLQKNSGCQTTNFKIDLHFGPRHDRGSRAPRRSERGKAPGIIPYLTVFSRILPEQLKPDGPTEHFQKPVDGLPVETSHTPPLIPGFEHSPNRVQAIAF